jgi:hypothetical protein
MSNVTSCLLCFSLLDDGKIKEINTFFDLPGYKQKPFVDVDDLEEKGWYGGSKMLETPIALGAFNYLDVGALCEHIRSLQFKEPENVQLIFKGQDDERFSIIDVFDVEY